MSALGNLKRKLHSRTLWVNSIAAAAVPLLELAERQLPSLRDALPPNLYAYAAFGLALVNFWLRMNTKQPVRPLFKGKGDGA